MLTWTVVVSTSALYLATSFSSATMRIYRLAGPADYLPLWSLQSRLFLVQIAAFHLPELSGFGSPDEVHHERRAP